MMHRKILTFCLLLVALCGRSLLAVADAPADGAGTEARATAQRRLTITADRMEMVMGQNARLEGNVIVADDKMTLNSDTMLIFFQDSQKKAEEAGQATAPEVPEAGNAAVEKEKTAGGEKNRKMELDRIEAIGHVSVRTADGRRSATGDRGIYSRKEDTLVLEGNCTMMSEGNLLTSNRVIYDRKKDTVSSERTTITIPNLGSGEDNGGNSLQDFLQMPQDSANGQDAPKEGK